MTYIKTYPNDEASLRKLGFKELTGYTTPLYMSKAGDKLAFLYYCYVTSSYHASVTRLDNYCNQPGCIKDAVSTRYPHNIESLIGTLFVKWNAYKETIEINGKPIRSLMEPHLLKNIKYFLGRTSLYFPLTPYKLEPDLDLFIDIAEYFISDVEKAIVYSSNYPVSNYINLRAFPMTDDDILLNSLLVKGNLVSWSVPFPYPNNMVSVKLSDGSYNIVESTESSFNVRFK